MHAARCGKPSAAALGIFIVSAAVATRRLLARTNGADQLDRRDIAGDAVDGAMQSVVGAHATFGRAAKTGARFGDRELITHDHLGEGRCRIYFGDIAAGLALLDEAMVSVEAREIPPMAVGNAYCTVIDTCHELFDLRRVAGDTARRDAR